MMSPWLMAGMDIGGGLAGHFLGQGQSPMTGIGMGLMGQGAGNLGGSIAQNQQWLGMINPYMQNAFGQSQKAIQGLSDIYSNPQAYMNNFRATTMGAQGIVPGANASIGGVGANYLDAANRGLFTGSSGSTNSQLAGNNAYINQGLNSAAANTYAGLGQMQANLPLQFGQANANLLQGNSQNLFGMGTGLNSAIGQGGAQQFGMGMNAYDQGNQQNQQYAQSMGGMMGGLTSGLTNGMGWQRAMQMMNGGQGGQGGGYGGQTIPYGGIMQGVNAGMGALGLAPFGYPGMPMPGMGGG